MKNPNRDQRFLIQVPTLKHWLKCSLSAAEVLVPPSPEKTSLEMTERRAYIITIRRKSSNRIRKAIHAHSTDDGSNIEGITAVRFAA